MDYGRKPNVLYPFTEDLFHLAPVPVVYHRVEHEDLDAFHAELIKTARLAFSEPVLEVPDVRHIHDLGSPPNFQDASWSEEQIAAAGVWHSVPTNGFLKLDAPLVKELRTLIEQRYLHALATLEGGHYEPRITESWIQFYKNGDYKVLHNHERYGPPYPNKPWAGAYYIDDGDPDPTMPYSGMFSFRIRQTNYYLRPYPGLLIMWPADILHQVHPFYGSRERIVINFNINSRT